MTQPTSRVGTARGAIVVQQSLFEDAGTPFWYFHQTGNGSLYPLEIGFAQIPSAQIPYDRQQTTRHCLEGCGLYGKNGGCPPYSPPFARIGTIYPYANVFYSRLYTRYYPPKVAQGRFYVRWSFVKALMERVVAKVAAGLSRELVGLPLGAGPCRACGNRKCSYKQGASRCRNPDQRVFSLESIGVLATELMPQLFGIDLQWFEKNDPDRLPEYMINVVAIMTKDEISLSTWGLLVHHIFASLASSYVPKSESEREQLLARDWRVYVSS